MMKSMPLWIIVGCILFILWSLSHLERDRWITSVFMMNSDKMSDQELKLLEQIKKEAARLEIKPIDAKIDPIWKGIPGYNGISVDIDQTFKYAKKLKGNIPYVYYEVEPEIQLDQLGPHPVYRGNPQKPITSIMVNVAWGNEYIPSILKTFEEENVRATFFLDGTWLSKNKKMALDILERGHELSNHAYSHKNMSQLHWETAKQEIQKTEKLLSDLNVQNHLFAPPSGDYNEDTVKLAHSLQLTTVMWSIDTLDWKNPHPQWIVKKVAAHIEPGALILMHPTKASSIALPQMIKEIKSRGLVIGTVSDVLSTRRIFEVESRFDF